MDDVQQLFPLPAGRLPLKNLYLEQDIRSIDTGGRPFIYTDYISSLDGRIAVPDSEGQLVVPPRIKNDRDWRLFQELAVQADIVFTSGRYLRDYVDGKVQEILQVHEDARFADLADWRVARGLPRQPDLAVVTTGADFPIPEPLLAGERRIVVVTTEAADPDKLQELEKLAVVRIAGRERVDGRRMLDALVDLGYRWMFNATGPQVMHMLLAAGVLDRLYLTQAARIIGGDPHASIVEGGQFAIPYDFRLSRLYLDPAALEGVGQLYSVYDRR